MAEFKYARDGTVCSLACGHPHCWSTLRNLGCRSPAWSLASSGSDGISQANTDEEGLPTLKVLNMMDDYGESPFDLYPSKFGGRASHRRCDSSMNTRSQADFSYRHAGGAGRRGGLSRSADGTTAKRDARPPIPTLRSVEVQEVFDMEELTDYWDETFVARPVYVWMPRHKSKKKNHTDAKQESINKDKKGPELVAVKNLTSELVPAFGLLPASLQHVQRNDAAECVQPEKAADDQSTAAVASKIEIPDKVPLPTGGQPYPNVGLTPHDRRQQLLNELRQLPKDFLVEIMEKASDLSDAGELIRLVEKYVSMMPRTRQEFLLAVGDVLTQKKLQPAEAVWLSNPQRALPSSTADQAYHLDDFQSGGGRMSRRELQRHSRLSHYDPLPGINAAGYSRPTKARRIYTNVGATVRYTARPFKYDSSVVDFSLGPVLTPPRSRYDRSTHSGHSSLTDFDHVRSNATADSESRQESRSSPFAEFRDYPGGTAVPALWSGSSSGRLLPKPPVGTPYTPFAGLRAAPVQLDTPAALQEGKKVTRDEAPDPAQVMDDSAVSSSAWYPKGDYWDDIRRHALLAAIDEGDEKSHDVLHRGNTTSPSAAASRLASALIAGRKGDRKSSVSPMVLRPGSRKTSARSLADSASTHGTEEPQLGTFRPHTGTSRGGSTPDHARSAASNWPQVDEEALLRRDDSANGVPPVDRVKRHVHVPTGEVETEAYTTPPTPTSTAPLVHETPELDEYKVVVAPPMPPPPSPEMLLEQTTGDRAYAEVDDSESGSALSSFEAGKVNEQYNASTHTSRGHDDDRKAESAGASRSVEPNEPADRRQIQMEAEKATEVEENSIENVDRALMEFV